MSKLPKAPLVEVIFEIKWDITNKADILDFQYIHGDLYSKLKDNYPYRENVVPPEVPFEVVKGMPVFRYRKDKNGYPLIQVGPGLLALNTNDDGYFWNNYLKEINNTLEEFNKIYPKFNGLILNPSITYIDFFEIDFSSTNPLDFINANLGLTVKQNFLENESLKTKEVNLTFNNIIGDNLLSLNLSNGKFANREGIVMQTKIIGKKEKYSNEELNNWLKETHEICSETFKKITKGKLYNSFK